MERLPGAPQFLIHLSYTPHFKKDTLHFLFKKMLSRTYPMSLKLGCTDQLPVSEDLLECSLEECRFLGPTSVKSWIPEDGTQLIQYF